MMLNEVREFEQYSFDCVNNHEPGRLKRKALIKNGYSGIGRAMTTVARYYMFLDNEEMIHMSPQAEQKAMLAIKLWCGSKGIEETPSVERVRNWLPNYIRHIHLADQIKRFYEDNEITDCNLNEERSLINSITINLTEEELCEVANNLRSANKDITDTKKAYIYRQYISPIISCIDAIPSLAIRRKGYGNPIFRFDPQKSAFQKSNNKKMNGNKNGTNDIKAITYEKVIAEAFYKGPLKRYYLCCNKKSLLNGYSEKKKDAILKTIASYLLNKNKDLEVQQWVFVNRTDIVNWLKDINEDEDYKKLTPSFFKTQTIGKNMVKLYIDDSWINHFTVVEEGFFHKEEWNDGVFFRDDGSLSYLVENELYQ